MWDLKLYVLKSGSWLRKFGNHCPKLTMYKISINLFFLSPRKSLTKSGSLFLGHPICCCGKAFRVIQENNMHLDLRQSAMKYGGFGIFFHVIFFYRRIYFVIAQVFSVSYFTLLINSLAGCQVGDL